MKQQNNFLNKKVKKLLFLNVLSIWLLLAPTSVQAIDVNFYGLKLSLAELCIDKYLCNDEKLINAEIKKIQLACDANYKIIDNFVYEKKLDGIGVYLLLNKITNAFNLDKSNSALFAYGYLKDRYDIILKYNQAGDLEIAYCSDIKFAYLHKRIGTKTYYSFRKVNDGIKNYFIYSGYKGNIALKKIDLRGLPNLNEDRIAEKLLTQKPDTNSILVKVNLDAIDYYKDIPEMLDYNYYISFVPSKSLINSSELIKDKLRDLSKISKIEVLLSIVQNITYYSDSNDRPMFPEETIYYNRGDCEDKSFLFSYFTTIIKMVPFIFEYKEHVNVGFKCGSFNEFTPQKTISYNGECYFLAETTNNSLLGNFIRSNDVPIKVFSPLP